MFPHQLHHRRPSQDTQTLSNLVPEKADNVCLPRSSPVKRNANPERKTVALSHISCTIDALVKIHKLIQIQCQQTQVLFGLLRCCSPKLEANRERNQLGNIGL